MQPIIYPYKMGSKSARALSNELKRRGHRALLVRSDGRYRPYRNHLVINWGNSVVPNWRHPTVGANPNQFQNSVQGVTRASNKLTAFRAMHEKGVSIPEFTTDINYVKEHWTDKDVLARTILTGHAGNGIEHVIWSTFGTDDHIPRAPLYVKYIKKSVEYRVHVFNNEVIDVQQKRNRQGVPAEDIDYKVRSHANGWVFCRENVVPDPSVLNESIAAVNALGLDFGAVDVIWNNHYNRAYVLEVNTAPGLEGTTLTNYVNKIEELL